MTGIDYEPASPSIENLMKSDAVICEEIYMDMTHKAKQMYDMDTCMTCTSSLKKNIFANPTMAIYGYPSVAQYVLSLYTNRVLLTFPYVSGVSVPAEE